MSEGAIEAWQNNEPKATWAKDDTTWMVNRHRLHHDIVWTSTCYKIEWYKGRVVIALCILYMHLLGYAHITLYCITSHCMFKLSNYTIDSHVCMVYPVYKIHHHQAISGISWSCPQTCSVHKNHYENHPKPSWKKPFEQWLDSQRVDLAKHNWQRRLHSGQTITVYISYFLAGHWRGLGYPDGRLENVRKQAIKLVNLTSVAPGTDRGNDMMWWWSSNAPSCLSAPGHCSVGIGTWRWSGLHQLS